MDKELQNLTIGTFAKAAGVNVETIRFYQRKKLLPAPERPYGSIRHYGNGDVARVKFVKAAQRLELCRHGLPEQASGAPEPRFALSSFVDPSVIVREGVRMISTGAPERTNKFRLGRSWPRHLRPFDIHTLRTIVGAPPRRYQEISCLLKANWLAS
jgi:hypothetical protein